MPVGARRALVAVLDVLIAVVLWPLALLVTGIAVAGLVSTGDPPPADGPYMLAVSVALIVMVAGWIAYLVRCVRKKSPAATVIAWARHRT